MISLVDASGGRMLTTETALPPAIVPTQTGLTFTADITFEEWSAIGQSFGRGMQSVAWCIGDWLVYGAKNFAKRVTPEAYDDAVAATGLDRQSLQQYASVCRNFPADARSPKLSFAHHRALAEVAPDRRERWMTILDSESKIRPTVRRLRASIRIAGDAPRILTDDDLLSRVPHRGAKTCESSLMDFIAFVRERMPYMDAEQKQTFQQVAAPRLKNLLADLAAG